MKILNLNIFFAILLFSFSAMGTNLKPFVSDGCTMAPDGTFKNPEKWRDCCVEHDLWFWGGGTKEQRQTADKSLKICIQNKSNEFSVNGKKSIVVLRLLSVIFFSAHSLSMKVFNKSVIKPLISSI